LLALPVLAGDILVFGKGLFQLFRQPQGLLAAFQHFPMLLLVALEPLFREHRLEIWRLRKPSTADRARIGRVRLRVTHTSRTGKNNDQASKF